MGTPTLKYTRLGGSRESRGLAEARALWALAWPVLLTTLLEFIPTQVSLVFVGHLDGSRVHLDGAALAVMIYNVLALSLCLGVTNALDTLCSQAVGAGRPELMGLYLQRALLAVGLLMLPLVAVQLQAEHVLLALGQPADVSASAGEYVRFLLPALPLSVLYDALRRPLLAQGVTRPMLYIAAAGSSVVAATAYVLVGPVAGVGYKGAALAVSVGAATSVALMMAYLLLSGRLPVFWRGFEREAVSLAGMRRFWALALPSVGSLITEWWSFEVLAIYAGSLPDSDTALAANAILFQVTSTTFGVYFGFSAASSVRVGSALGDGDAAAARMSSRVALGMAACAATVLGTALAAAHRHVAIIFTSDEEVGRLVSRAVLATAAYQLCDAMVQGATGVLRGAGEQRITAAVSFVAYWIIGLPAAYVAAFHFGWGLPGIWWAFAAAIGLAAVLSVAMALRADYEDLADKAAERLGQEKGAGATHGLLGDPAAAADRS